MSKKKQDDYFESNIPKAMGGVHVPLRTDDPLPLVPCQIEVERVTEVDLGSSLGNVRLFVNGFRFSVGIMQGSEVPSDLWVAWPSRRGRNGTSYAVLEAADEHLRYTIEQTALNAFYKKRFSKLYADSSARLGLDKEEEALSD